MPRRYLMHVLASSLGVLACDQGNDATVRPEPAPAERARGLDAKATRMLALVPADTPYVWLNAEPLPAAYVDRVAPLVDATLAAWGRALDQPIDTDDAELAALVAAFRGHMSQAGLEQLGFATNPRMIVYGLGLAPVVRLELRDGNAVAKLLEHIDAADGKIDVRTIEGHPVWTSRGSRHPFVAAIAVVDDELVITMYPPDVEDRILPHAIGAEPPRDSLLRSDWLRDAKREHGLLPHGIGMVDLSRVMAIAAGESDPLARAVAKAWDVELDENDCTPALRSWVARAPRVWFGLREIGARGITGATIWEFDDGLRKDLRGLVAPIAGLGQSQRDEGLAALAIGIDAAKAIAMIDRWRHDDRFRGCPVYDDDGDGPQVPAWLDGVQGGSAVLHDWDPARERVSGVFVVGVDEPLDWLAAVMPTADSKLLRRSGRVVALDKALGLAGAALMRSTPWLKDAWIARGRHALGIAAGDGTRAHLRRAVGNHRTDRRTLITWSLDIAGLLDVIPRAELRDALAKHDPAVAAAYEALLDALARAHGSVAVSDHGLELTSSIDLHR